MVYGVLVYGVWCRVYGVWCMVYVIILYTPALDDARVARGETPPRDDYTPIEPVVHHAAAPKAAPVHSTEVYWYCTPFTVLYTIHCTVHHSLYCTPFTVLYNIHCTVHHSLYCTPFTVLYTIHCTVHHSLYCTPFTVLYAIHFIPYTIQHTPYTVHHTPYTVHHMP